MSECLEAIDASLDADCCSGLSTQGLLRAIWILTRQNQKPTTAMVDLRCNFYPELNLKLHRAFLRLSAPEGSRVRDAKAQIDQQEELTDEFFQALAASHGFEDDWVSLEPVGRKAKAKRAAKAKATVDDQAQEQPDGDGDIRQAMMVG